MNVSRFHFDIATGKDEPELRQILRDNPMGGEISLSFLREPDYFNSLMAEGKDSQVVIVREEEEGLIAGFGTRSIKTLFVNGHVCSLGYLSNLRLNREYRGGSLIVRAYRFMKQLHQDGRVPVYLTTIMSDNHAAIKALTGARAGLPDYCDWGEYVTAVIVPTQKHKKTGCDFTIVRGSEAMLDEIIAFMHQEGPKKQFFPYYSREDFLGGELLPCFRINDFHVLLQGGMIVGIAGKWDQGSFRQTVIAGYGRRTAIVRPFYNLAAKIGDLPVLSPKGTTLNFCYGSFLISKDNNLHIFRALLCSLLNESAASGYPFLVVGLHANDPLVKVLQDFRCLTVKSRLYIVVWPEDRGFLETIDSRVPYLELGTI